MSRAEDWITTPEVDPRMPTDPDFVSLEALSDKYEVSRGTLVELAGKYPRIAQTSEGNPWTENEGDETLFLHEPSVSRHFDKIKR